jgi:A/G-specific adenine glycosylase
MNNASKIRSKILSWYDAHARVLPWRSKPFECSDPYHVWLSEVMLQQTTVTAVIPYFEKFISIWPNVRDLASATQDDVLREWAGLGYYSRARNLHKCAIAIVHDFNGAFPTDVKILKSLPGIGDYTSAAIASIAFDVPSVVIDGNVERVISRLHRIDIPLPDSKPIIREYAHNLFVGDNQDRPSCFAQSLMDLGATVCTPKSPKCSLCPISKYCTGFEEGDAPDYPKKRKKVKIPEKYGIAYIYVHEGKIGVERRPEKGMLAGMVGFPTSEWEEGASDGVSSEMEKHKIRHVFTHFALTLYPKIIQKKTDDMIEFSQVEKIGMPTLFKKLWNMIESDL